MKILQNGAAIVEAAERVYKNMEIEEKAEIDVLADALIYHVKSKNPRIQFSRAMAFEALAKIGVLINLVEGGDK